MWNDADLTDVSLLAFLFNVFCADLVQFIHHTMSINDATLKALNEFLEDKSYIEG